MNHGEVTLVDVVALSVTTQEPVTYDMISLIGGRTYAGSV